uniref:MFS domain-containing protein n=1 Tax=Heterorhabditis bacteriophora TaxID=37862 RepID=A0A1I7XTJ4_HETBA
MLLDIKPNEVIKLSDTDLLLRTSEENSLLSHNGILIYSDPTLIPTLTKVEACDQVPSVNVTNASVPSVTDEVYHGTLGNTPSADHLIPPLNGTRLKSDLEIRNQHYQKQKQYAEQKRQRRLTDIDFEGILNIIGGCSNWQVLVYLMISVQQVPHAMFNLSVVYMMYQPDHWCKTTNKQRNGMVWHDQCHFYKRDYVHLKNLPFNQVENITTINVQMERCEDWEYDQSVMEKTVVTEWNRVCDNNWSRAHVHMSYSLGYLMGGLVGGFVSDRYGRKTAIYGFGILSMIFGFLLAYSREFEIFLVVRFLLAASNEAADLAAYVLCMEITGVKYRSIVGSLLQAPWACGYAFLALIAYLTKSWTTIHVRNHVLNKMITVGLHCIALVFVHFLPESPRWLILVGRVEDAENIIRKACKNNNSRLPSDLGLVRHAEKRKWMKKDERPSYFHLFRASELRVRNAMLFVIWANCNCLGVLRPSHCIVRSIISWTVTDDNSYWGRNSFAHSYVCYNPEKNHRKACIQGAFNILYIFTSELNPTIVRNSAVGISSMIARMGAGASGYIAILSDVTLPIVPMLIFAVFSLCAGILVMFLPETQDLPLPDTIWDAVSMLKSKQKPCVHFSDEVMEGDNLKEPAYEPA